MFFDKYQFQLKKEKITFFIETQFLIIPSNFINFEIHILQNIKKRKSNKGVNVIL